MSESLSDSGIDPVEPHSSTITGQEDVDQGITWQNLVGVSNSAASSVTITELQGDGQLLLNGSSIGVGTTITKEQVDDGQLTFRPGEHESGFDGFGSDESAYGVGDQQQDYAKLGYTINLDASGETTIEGVLTIDIVPVVDAPTVSIAVTPKVSSGDGAGDATGITKVNGGSQAEHGQGFDVVNGKIVAIGENVRVWYTDAKTGSTQNNNVKHYQDLSEEDINTIIENSIGGKELTTEERNSLVAEMRDNFISYTQGNANAGDSGKSKTDVFVLHENSHYQQGTQVDNQGTTYHSYKMNAGTGNGGNGNAPDFIFLLEKEGVEYEVGGVVSHEWHENEPNHNDSWNITADGSSIVSGFNQLAGLITSSGGYFGSSGLVVPDDDSSPAYAEYEVSIVAHVTDQDGSEKMLQEIELSGLPSGTTIVLPNGTELTVGADGKATITGEFSNYENAGDETQVSSEIIIRVPEGASFELKAEAKAYETALGSSITENGETNEPVGQPDVDSPEDEEGNEGGDGDQNLLADPSINIALMSQRIIIDLPDGDGSLFVGENGELETGSYVVKDLNNLSGAYQSFSENELLDLRKPVYEGKGSITGYHPAGSYILLSGSPSDYDLSRLSEESLDDAWGGLRYVRGTIIDETNPDSSTENGLVVDFIKGVIFEDGSVLHDGELSTAYKEYDLRIDAHLNADAEDAEGDITLKLNGLTEDDVAFIKDGNGQLIRFSVDGNGNLVLPALTDVEMSGITVKVKLPENHDNWSINAEVNREDGQRDESMLSIPDGETLTPEGPAAKGDEPAENGPSEETSFGENLLVNGSFAAYSGYDVKNGYQGWQSAGSFSGDKLWSLNNLPFTGLLRGDLGVSSLSQQVEGVHAGSVLSLSVGWVNHTLTWDDTPAVRLEVELGGKVYAVLKTSAERDEQAGMKPAASFEGVNGAVVNQGSVDPLASFNDKWHMSGNDLPQATVDFTQLTVTLPDDVPEGSLVFRWIPEGNTAVTDNILIADVALATPIVSAEPEAEPMAMQMFSLDTDDEEGSEQEGNKPLGSDDGVFMASQVEMSPGFDTLILLGTEDGDWLATDSADEAGSDANASSGDTELFDVDMEDTTSLFDGDANDVGLGDILDEFMDDEDLTSALENAFNHKRDANGAEEDDASDMLETDDVNKDDDGTAAESAKVVSGQGALNGSESSGGSPAAPDLDADAMEAQRDIAQQMIDAGRQGGDMM